uniref:Small ribosomal subunit protein bS1c n=1 Tax=Schizymenia dubyi TaxID=38368 RepID=A0A1C9C9I4_9FLOR|nr:ribosomal protein S1 [Schizymenia dubyi]AOM65034.1 ribosomal protein S1 [Schizymenia dubyi]
MNNKKGFSGQDFGSMLDKYSYSVHPGDIVAGTIFHKEPYGFLVDVGVNIAGYLPSEELSLIINNQNAKCNFINDTREFFILAYKVEVNQLILSIKRLEYIRAWKRIKQLQQEDVVLQLNIVNINKGGFITNLEGLQSFIPNSHISIQERKKTFINSTIQCQLLIADEQTNQLILSNKRALLSIFANQFQIGDIVSGEITQIKTYGIFIKIYNIPALLHISEISDNYIKNIHDVFQIGKQIKVKIIHIDMKQGRLSVSRKNFDFI